MTRFPDTSPTLAPDALPLLDIGSRVRMNALGRTRHPRYGAREGVIVGRGSPSSWRVQFDERRSVQAIHQSYLEGVSANTALARRSQTGKRVELAR